jgi:SAM-dependent methyltransferase
MKAIEKLPDRALVPFDIDFRDWELHRAILQEVLGASPPAHILDVGGGNGRHLDQLLALFPEARGDLVDNSPKMLRGNAPHPRKTLHQLSGEELSVASFEVRFDLITVNVLLHHLVAPSYQECRRNCLELLVKLTQLLAPEGHLVVHEQCYRARWPWLYSPGKVIHRISSIRSWPLSSLIRRLGANTAGVGVAFRSTDGWRELLEEAGLVLERIDPLVIDDFRWYDPFLNIGRCATVLFVGTLPR